MALLGLTAAATAVFEAFFWFDWDEGVARGGFVVVLLGLLWLARALGARLTPTAWPRGLVAVSGLGAAVLLQWHFKEGLLSAQHARHSEMGDIHARAVPLLLAGHTPWHLGTVLDSGSFKGLVGSPEVTACRTSSRPPTEAEIDELWASPRPGLELFPERLEASDCAEARRLLALSGYKYGPVMLAAYLPLVAPFGRAGVYVTHLVFLLAIIGAMAVLLRGRGPEALIAACFVLLGQSVLRRDTLLDSDCDLIPTALMLWALVAFVRGRPITAGALTGLTLAAKVFPAAFLLPLLIVQRERWRALASFVVASALTWGPAVAVDGVGVWDNVFGFNLGRPADSTALAFFLPPWALVLLRVTVLAVAAWAFVRLVRRNEPVPFVAFVMGLFFLSTKVFHNNYLVWWLPVVGVSLASALTKPRPT